MYVFFGSVVLVLICVGFWVVICGGPTHLTRLEKLRRAGLLMARWYVVIIVMLAAELVGAFFADVCFYGLAGVKVSMSDREWLVAILGPIAIAYMVTLYTLPLLSCDSVDEPATAADQDSNHTVQPESSEVLTGRDTASSETTVQDLDEQPAS